VLERGLLTAEQVDAILSVEAMTKGGVIGNTGAGGAGQAGRAGGAGKAGKAERTRKA
jgi:hypothetical protein